MNTTLFNVADFLKIGIMAFAAVYLTNKVLRSVGAPQFTTSGV